jgi:hypothetical protein
MDGWFDTVFFIHTEVNVSVRYPEHRIRCNPKKVEAERLGSVTSNL